MMKNELVECFNNTIEIANGILKKETINSIQTNRVYKENFVSNKRNSNKRADIYVSSGTTFATAKNYISCGKVAVLNFANPHYPGGGVTKGAKAQEECLCRSSNLYHCISNQNVFNDYYLYNRNIGNYFFSDRLIYTKGVTVFKDDSEVPQMMPESEWFNVDVITCAAPYIANCRYTNKTALKQLFKGRIKNIFESAIDNDVDVIILGAFGCGAFKNPPEIAAKAFHEVIDENAYNKYFKNIVFAIKSNNEKNDNYDVFFDEFFGEYGTTLLVTPPLPFVEPLRSKCDDFKYSLDYQSWKNRNKYFEKQFSILGDSISTLAGYNPKGYKVFYDGENCEKSGVRDMKDTWWGKVIDFFGGELLVNNSWSGSRVTRLPNSNIQFPSGCSDERTSNLHINNFTPDVIIIYLGFNDWANGVNIYSDETRARDILFDDCFSEAYEMMINKLKGNYPKAEIWCCTLNTTFMSSNKSFNFSYKHSGIHIEEYNKQIKHIAEKNRCKVIDLYNHHTPYDTIDGSHPNANGMNTLATLIIKEIGKEEVDKFLGYEKEINEIKEEVACCPYCKKEIGLGGNYCPFCGKSLDGDPNLDICPNCKKRTLKHTVGFDYCINCDYEALLYFNYKSIYIWDSSNMNIENMKSFEISFGDCPIFNISYDGEKLTVYNRINPRDGGINFPDGFFSDKTVNLTNEEKINIINFLKKIDFNKWKTEDNVIKNYEEGACGFCINNSLTIAFKNGKCFKCYEPTVKEFNQLVDFLKGFCDTTWFEPFYNYGNDENGYDVLLEEKYDTDVDYVYLPQNMTRHLFDNTLKLYDLDTNQNIEIKKNKIDAGRNLDCDLRIDSNYISHIQASFYYEDSSWFIMDRNSMNGTWLNGTKLDKNKKYELSDDDVISFAGIKKYVFYKMNVKDDSKTEEDKLISALEESLENLSYTDDSTNVLKLIAFLLSKIPVYLPVDYSFSEAFGNVDPMKLKPGDVITNDEEIRMKILTLKLDDEEIVPIFTSLDEAHKGPSASFMRMYPQDYLPTVIAMNKSIALNVYNNNGISLKNQFFKDVVFQLVLNDLKEENNKSTEIKVGTIINDKYELIKQIGQGGLTKVYLARDTRINKAWAVKIVEAEANNNISQIRDSIIQEAQMMKLLNHPAIPKIVDIINTSKYIAIVMDYIEGETLESIVKEFNSQPQELVIDWMKQLCDALEYLHSQNPPLIHRDVKPENIVLKPDGKIVIIDFSIMRTYKPNHISDTQNLGTMGYAAPEQFIQRQTDARTDMFGLGMTMYRLLTGINPKANIGQVLPICQIRPNLSKKLERIVKKCIEFDPDKRYQSMQELCSALNRCDLPKNTGGKLKQSLNNLFKKNN